MRQVKHNDIVAMRDTVAGYKLLRKQNDKLVSVNSFHGNVKEYDVGMITEAAQKGIYVYHKKEKAIADAPTSAGDTLVLVKVFPIGKALKKETHWNTYTAVYVAEIVETVAGTAVNVGDTLFAPKKSKFFTVKAIHGNEITASKFSPTYEGALKANGTQILTHIGNCQKVALPANAPIGLTFIKTEDGWESEQD